MLGCGKQVGVWVACGKQVVRVPLRCDCTTATWTGGLAALTPRSAMLRASRVLNSL